MTLQWIPLDHLEPHPENSNRMPPRLLEKLKAHIQRTGLYEPLVVRPLQCGVRSAECGANENGNNGAAEPSTQESPASTPHATRSLPAAAGTPNLHYQILNGHHRAEVLRQLGHTHARCDVWEVDDAEARVLLATLNRLEGRDDPAARAQLVARLAEGGSAEQLARLLPEPADAIERLLAIAKPPPAPLALEAVEVPARPMTFFLTDEQHEVVGQALREAAAPAAPKCSRAEALERLALWYLEARNLR